jgi:hypothetical protein
MTNLSVLRSRLTDTLSTPDDADDTAGAPTGLVRQIGFALGPALAPTLAGPS